MNNLDKLLQENIEKLKLNEIKVIDVDVKVVEMDNFVQDLNRRIVDSSKNKTKIKHIDKQLETYSNTKSFCLKLIKFSNIIK